MKTSPPPSRMRSSDRRESILKAATAVFGANAYVGTTTDEVARAAGVSQPYVVRMFGSKEKLFIEVLDRTVVVLLDTFRAALASSDPQDRHRAMGEAYIGLLSERGMLMTLTHAFALGGEPRIGAAARKGFARVWTFLRDEAGFDAGEARQFLANGMLINTIIGLRLTGDYGTDDDVTELLDTCFPDKLESLLDLGPRTEEPW